MAMVFYKTIIQSKVDYCSVVWGNTAKTRIAKLQKILNRALRIVMRVKWTFPSEALFQLIQTKFNNHIDTLSDRSNKQLLHIMYKIVNEKMPPTICKLFSFKKYIYSLRKATLQLEVPKPTTNFKKRSFAYRGAKMWNSLSNDVKQSTSFATFKNMIDKT